MNWFHRPERRPPRLLTHYGGALYLLWMLLGIASLFLFWTPLDAGFDEAMRWLWLPWAIIVAGFMARYWQWLLGSGRPRWKGPVLAIGTCGVLILMSGPYVLLANAVGAKGWATYRGAAIHKFVSGTRGGGSPVVVFRDSAGRGDISVRASRASYETLRMGEPVECRFRTGSLGIPFRWRYRDEGPACEALGM